MNPPYPIWLYRITHINNLEAIIDCGGLVSAQSHLANPKFIRIGDSTMIDYRRKVLVPNPPGGTLSDYIPFYLGPRSPMLLQIATGYEGVTQIPQEEIIYLISNVDEITSRNIEYFFFRWSCKEYDNNLLYPTYRFCKIRLGGDFCNQLGKQ